MKKTSRLDVTVFIVFMYNQDDCVCAGYYMYEKVNLTVYSNVQTKLLCLYKQTNHMHYHVIKIFTYMYKQKNDSVHIYKCEK